MSKILISVLILSFMTCSLCNFLLESPKNFENSLSNYGDLNQLKPEDFLDFANGGNEGFKFFYQLPGDKGCKTIDPRIIAIAKEITEDIKTLNIFNFVQIIQNSIARGQKIIEMFAAQGEECKIWAKELKRVFEMLVNRTKQKKYGDEALFHAFSNMNPIVDSGVAIIKHFIAKEYFQAGKRGGELMRFIFFWDL
jgi:hypothetical protein